MARVISVHEYELKPASRKPLSSAPCMTPNAAVSSTSRAHRPPFPSRPEGSTARAYTAIWIFESREAWERLWGTVEAPRPPSEYPELENLGDRILASFLTQDPDTIRFTSYEEV